MYIFIFFLVIKNGTKPESLRQYYSTFGIFVVSSKLPCPLSFVPSVWTTPTAIEYPRLAFGVLHLLFQPRFLQMSHLFRHTRVRPTRKCMVLWITPSLSFLCGAQTTRNRSGPI